MSEADAYGERRSEYSAPPAVPSGSPGHLGRFILLKKVPVQQSAACPLDEIYQQHSQSMHHDYQASFLLLDVDMSGLPA